MLTGNHLGLPEGSFALPGAGGGEINEMQPTVAILEAPMAEQLWWQRQPAASAASPAPARLWKGGLHLASRAAFQQMKGRADASSGLPPRRGERPEVPRPLSLGRRQLEQNVVGRPGFSVEKGSGLVCLSQTQVTSCAP